MYLSDLRQGPLHGGALERGSTDALHREIASYSDPSQYMEDRSELQHGMILRLGKSAMLIGPRDQALPRHSSATALLDISLRPVGWQRFFGLDASQFVNRDVMLRDVVGDRFKPLIEQLGFAQSLEEKAILAGRFLTEDAPALPAYPPIAEVEQLQNLLDADEWMSVDELCAAMSLSQARLARLAIRSFGFRPKLLTRRHRFAQMLHMLNTRPYAEWRFFIDPSYVDQSHFIRDCHFFLSCSPTAYLSAQRQAQGKVPEHLVRQMAA